MSKKSATGSKKSIDESFKETFHYRIRIGRDWKYGLGFFLSLVFILVIMTLVDNRVGRVVQHPILFTFGFFSLITWIIGNELEVIFDNILEVKGEAKKEQLLILEKKSHLTKIRLKSEKQLLSTSHKAGHLGVFVIFYAIVFVVALYFYEMIVSETPDLIVLVASEIVIWIYWGIIFLTFLSQVRIIRILKDYVSSFFTKEYPISLLTAQESFFDLINQETDEKSVRKLPSVDYSSSHYGFLKVASSLVRKSRALYIIASVFLVEFIAVLWTTQIQPSTETPSNYVLYLLSVLIFISLLVLLLYSGADYLETEWHIHRVLDSSKKNLIILYDAVLLRSGLEVVSGNLRYYPESANISTKEEIELAKSLMDHAKALPTWTIDAKVAGGITITVVVQIIILFVNIFLGYLNLLPTT